MYGQARCCRERESDECIPHLNVRVLRRSFYIHGEPVSIKVVGDTCMQCNVY